MSKGDAMTRMKLVGSLLVVLVLAAKPAAAQLCVGNPSFVYGAYQPSIAAGFSSGVRGVEAGVAAGGNTLFGGAGLLLMNFTDIDVKTAGVYGNVGAELAVDRANKIMVCPAVRLDVLAGPDVGPVDNSTVALQGGASIGMIVSDQGDMQIVPFFGLALVHNRLSSSFAGSETTFTDNGGHADFGVGFVFNHTTGIIPSVSVPFDLGGSDATFMIRFAFNFGK
jgi:hypothetical protein